MLCVTAHSGCVCVCVCVVFVCVCVCCVSVACVRVCVVVVVLGNASQCDTPSRNAATRFRVRSFP